MKQIPCNHIRAIRPLYENFCFKSKFREKMSNHAVAHFCIKFFVCGIHRLFHPKRVGLKVRYHGNRQRVGAAFPGLQIT